MTPLIYTGRIIWTVMTVLLIAPADLLSHGVLTDLQFEEARAARQGKFSTATPLQVSQTVRMLCSTTSDPQQVGHKYYRSTLCLSAMINVVFPFLPNLLLDITRVPSTSIPAERSDSFSTQDTLARHVFQVPQ